MVGVQSASSGKKSFNQFSETALHEAARGGQIEDVKYLVENGAEVNAKDEFRETALHEAARGGHIDVVIYLVEHGAEVNARTWIGQTALHEAVGGGHVDVVKYLVEHGAEVNARRTYGQTAFHVAARGGHFDVVKYLVEHGAEVNVGRKFGETALREAARGGHFDVVKYLVEHGAEVNAGRKFGETALREAARGGHFDVVKYLVEHGAEVNAGRKFGETALNVAAWEGHIDVVIYLVEHGAEVNARTEFGETALREAARGGHFDVVKYLVENGAVEDKSLQNAIIWAAEKANVMVLNFLVEYCTKVQDAKREDKLREAMLKIETLEKINKSLAKHNKTLERQVNKSFVRSEVVGIPLDDVVDVTREYNSSGPREARPLKSQFDVLTVEDFSYFVDNYCEMAKQVDSLKAALRERKEVSESKQAELITVQADNEKLVAEMKKLEAESLELACDNVSWFTHCEKLKAKLEGGKGRSNDDGDGNYSVEDGESPNQEVPVELAGFSNPFNCEISCSSCVVLFVLYVMGLCLCFQRFMMYLACKIPGVKSVENVVEKKCSLSLTDFSKAGLLENKDVFNVKITGEYTVYDALRDARKELKNQSYPAVLAIEYEKNADGAQPVGHSVAMMPDGKYIDVQERRYWEPTPNSRISHIHVVNVKKSEITVWKRNCGLQNCKDECIVCSTEYSNDSLK